MSDNTINAAFRRLGHTSEEQTGRGFHTMAGTLLNEQSFPPDVIELQLAHSECNEVRAAYNEAQRLPERRKMMQAWADYLDGLRAGGQIVPIRRRRLVYPLGYRLAQFSSRRQRQAQACLQRTAGPSRIRTVTGSANATIRLIAAT
jgi:hypothetical protein